MCVKVSMVENPSISWGETMKEIVAENSYCVMYGESTLVHENEWAAIHRILHFLDREDVLDMFEPYYSITAYETFEKATVEFNDGDKNITPSLCFDVDGTIVAIHDAGLGTDEVRMWIFPELSEGKSFMYDRTAVVRK